MDFAECGRVLLTDANNWIDAARAPSVDDITYSFSHDLSDSQKTQVYHLIQTYKRLPSQVFFFHGYLHYVVGEALFRDFVRFANSLTTQTHA